MNEQKPIGPRGPRRSPLLRSDAPPRIRMIAFAVAFVVAAIIGLLAGAGVSSLAIASIAGGLASLGIEWSWQLRAGRRRR
ncbi:MAG: hypothetical protein ABSH51_25135 [Solirubrobacteraceae bacterium]|jgi:hypothetical protein